jgi:hypothetical protein
LQATPLQRLANFWGSAESNLSSHPRTEYEDDWFGPYFIVPKS